MKGFLFCILFHWKGICIHTLLNVLLLVPGTHLCSSVFPPIPFPPLFLLLGPCESQYIFYSQNVPLIPTAREQTGTLACTAWLIRKQGCMVRSCSRQEHTPGCATPSPEGESLLLPKQSKSQQPAAPCAPSTLLCPGCALGEENRGKEMAWKC